MRHLIKLYIYEFLTPIIPMGQDAAFAMLLVEVGGKSARCKHDLRGERLTMDPVACSLVFPLYVLRFSTQPEDLDGGRCLACDVYLELHQPDAQVPERLLGTCEACGRWYVIDRVSGTDESVMTLLPEGVSIRNALVSKTA